MVITIPGEFAGISEEISPGFNTFEENGSIYSSVVGEPVVDKTKRVISIKRPCIVKPLRRGDIVIAFVSDIYDQIAQVRIASVESKHNIAVSSKVAFIRISEIDEGYVEQLRDHLKIGDYLRAKIIDVTDLGTYISIIEPELGVITAFCSSCRSEMQQNGSTFTCKECKTQEKRKAAQTN